MGCSREAAFGKQLNSAPFAKPRAGGDLGSRGCLPPSFDFLALNFERQPLLFGGGVFGFGGGEAFRSRGEFCVVAAVEIGIGQLALQDRDL